MKTYGTIFIFLCAPWGMTCKDVFHVQKSYKQLTSFKPLAKHFLWSIHIRHPDSLAELNKINKNQEIFGNFRLKSCNWIRQWSLFFLHGWNWSITGGSTGSSSVHKDITLQNNSLKDWFNWIVSCKCVRMCIQLFQVIRFSERSMDILPDITQSRWYID